ncbi:MAG: hypothetical protein D6790_15060 [Caldilineae bacterium]|nr:MAG: hypothetical protein D6790_15060 [Caldilineae bacterium]
MAKSKKIIDLAREEFGKRDQRRIFIPGQSPDTTASVGEQVAEEDAELAAARRYNATIDQHAERYLRLEPVRSGLVLLRHYVYIPRQGTLVRLMPRINVVDDSRPMNKKTLTIPDPFPFVGQAIVVKAHADTGLKEGDRVVATVPHKMVTMQHVGYDGLFVAPGGDPDGALGYTGETSDYGYRIVTVKDILFKL